MKQYIGIVRDHSASMRPNRIMAARDYNLNIENIKQAATRENIDTIISVVECGSGIYGVRDDVVNSSITAVQPIIENRYDANGSSTPLFDSVGRLIEIFEKVPDRNDPSVSFLIMAITDGEENASHKWSAIKLNESLRQLQSTDRWTFVFRVPRGYANQLSRLGIARGNILEWELTEAGLQVATEVTREAFTNYYTARSMGVKSTDKFFANLNHVSPTQIKQSLINIANDVQLVSASHTSEIRPLVESLTSRPYKTGSTFYELVKTETVQQRKKIAIRDRRNGEIYSGDNARQLLGLPYDHSIKLVPGDHNGYDIFIQSTSVNRKVPVGTKLMIWDNVA